MPRSLARISSSGKPSPYTNINSSGLLTFLGREKPPCRVHRPSDVLLAVRRGNETRLELGWSQVKPPLQQEVKETAETGCVALLGGFPICYGPRCEEEREHGPHSVHC